ncbi:MAG: lytic murein transglycosylase [Methylorubrum extorquens]|jgi:membrane-bound lytic murein transglycosylase B|uniref:Membrane bound lytic murein transglycosylase B, mltB n=1 Tax=Methylorubrum extorquens (strain DSM 6343 / CIP 106787 / DM4) TaxID=661410 RepID=C7CB56_METED|nr:lytic murein transglycosylase [Methylorubrum extorquens]CAX25468.1 putative membrane bound lytic murein transglycosylase B, mltB [Methylorubrum extorquens DM4]
MQPSAKALLLAAAILAGPIPARAEAPTDPAPPDFAYCLGALKTLAEERGVPRTVAETALSGIAPDPSVVPATQSQAEFVKPVWEYIEASVTPERIATGQARLAQWSEVLGRIEAAYGVDRHILVAFWGVESNYGAALEGAGIRPVVSALATLACGDPARPGLWRDELVAALKILADGDADAERMRGSWAGAMGHTQFMPTAFLRHAVDFDGDGRRDIWHSVPDALASTANFLKQSGWRVGEGWGLEVLLPDGFDYRVADETTERPFAEWQRLGLKPANGAFPDGAERRAALLLPTGAKGPAFLLEPNFRVILRYNTALAYALTVAHLSDRLRGAPGFTRDWPRTDRMLTTEERTDLQTRLAALGHPVGGADGKIGPKTRAAIRAFQEAKGLVPDGYADAALLDRVRAADKPAP